MSVTVRSQDERRNGKVQDPSSLFADIRSSSHPSMNHAGGTKGKAGSVAAT